MNEAARKNRAIYEDLWKHYKLFPCQSWKHVWPEIQPLYLAHKTLEIGPGLFPHIPVQGGHFVDLSGVALKTLAAHGGCCVKATVPLPYADGQFDMVCLFEVAEHVQDDAALFAEVARVLQPGGVLFMSCPLNPAYFTYYDRVMGHVRRYGGDELRQKLEAAGFKIEKVCPRHDRMDPWFGAVFGFGMRYLPGLTAKVVQHYLPKVAGLPWKWEMDKKLGAALERAETLGGLTLRAGKTYCGGR